MALSSRSLFSPCFVFVLAAWLGLASLASGETWYTIEVTDGETGRGVPLVEAIPSAGDTYITDSNGLINFPRQDGCEAIKHIVFRSYGYREKTAEFDCRAEDPLVVALERINLAERIYRATGEGIYQATVALGLTAPIAHPLANANVRGQDSVQFVHHRDQVYWFWGDTVLIKPVHKFPAILRSTGAVSSLPQGGGLLPQQGIDYDYFARQGTVSAMMPGKRPGLIWVDGLFEIEAPSGGKRILGHYVRNNGQVLGDFKVFEQGLFIFSNRERRFHRLFELAMENRPLHPQGHSLRHDGYIYFCNPYPVVRVKDDWYSVTNTSQWEAYTPLQQGTRYAEGQPALVLDRHGKPRFGWRKNTEPLSNKMVKQLIDGGYLQPEDSPLRAVDVQSGKPVELAAGSVHWNDYRQAWVMIAGQIHGDSPLGEIWLSEARQLEGPWSKAIKIATHHGPQGDQSFYNPVAMPFFNQEGDRVIYFQGTYAKFMTKSKATPLYDYNQIVYRLDLAKVPRLLN